MFLCEARVKLEESADILLCLFYIRLSTLPCLEAVTQSFTIYHLMKKGENGFPNIIASRKINKIG